LERFKLLGLDDEHADAAVIAWAIKRYPSRLLEILAEADRPKLQLVLDALNGKRTQQHLRTDQAKIMRAHEAAEWVCGRRRWEKRPRKRKRKFCQVYDVNVPAPTLFLIRMQYAKFEGLQPPPNRIQHRRWLRDLTKRGKIPQDKTFQSTMTRCGVEFRLEKPRKV
jgi:hypothetical protein